MSILEYVFVSALGEAERSAVLEKIVELGIIESIPMKVFEDENTST